jgi:AcrR family transcriptional regulator
MKLKAGSQPRDAEATRSRILDAAEEEFAALGLSGARTESIAAKTGVTKAMIYYYYESKERLYEAVLERGFAQHTAAAADQKWHTGDPVERAEEFIRGFLERAAANPKIPGIVVYESMQNQGKYYEKTDILSMYRTLASILERGMAEGCFRTVDPYHTAVTIIGACVFYFCSRDNYKQLWPGKDVLSPEMVKAHMEDAIHLILQGLRKLS